MTEVPEVLVRKPAGWAALLLALLLSSGCGAHGVATSGALAAPALQATPVPVDGPAGDAAPVERPLDPFLDELQHRTFSWFWDTADPQTGLVPDRWPAPSFSSVAAVGFGLASYAVGVERGWVTREQARDRVLLTLRFLLDAPQGPQPSGVAGHRGLFYHFLDMRTGHRWAPDVELSTIDTALLMAGVLVVERAFDRDEPVERDLRDVARRLYERADWRWAQPRAPAIAMGWKPEEGFASNDWKGYDESAILFLLALGSPTHPAADGTWETFTATYRWAEHEGQTYLNFAPLFGHQYSHAFVDFRGIRDAFMREKGSDYFENSQRAVLAQRAYARRNPLGFHGYSAEVWGLTACDGPADVTLTVDGRTRRFLTYGARGVSSFWSNDDGTIAPTAAAASVPFAPEAATACVKAIRRLWGEHVFGAYGFFDAFNPTFRDTTVPTPLGRVVPGVGWFATNHLGIDQGPIVLMIENHRSEMVWRLTRTSAPLLRGLRLAGFSGGWLDPPPAGP